jgi:ferric-dicitrate binding protein FerR (iron transport regulator)
MHTERISFLLDRFLENTISPAEMRELEAFLEKEGHGSHVHAILAAMIEREGSDADYQEERFEPVVAHVLGRGARVVRLVRRAAVAAVILILAGGGVWWGLRRTGVGGERPAIAARKPTVMPDIPPGGNKATLTLADNTTIDLDEAKEGVVSKQGNQEIVKRKGGQLAYQGSVKGAGSPSITFNVLSTPRGGQYQLLLPDGSKVWLNAASSLRYPTKFAGQQRLVELTGEAYFEIAPNAKMPFRVAVAGHAGSPVQVDVLGTSFDVKAYKDESVVNTTLLNGSVRVTAGAGSVVVKPGEKAAYTGGDAIRVGETDVEEAVAWKNGLFKFNEATIEDVMRQLSRWYDVEVKYENGAPKDLFQGEIYRNVNVSRVLKVLEASGVHFRVEGKTIIVQ